MCAPCLAYLSCCIKNCFICNSLLWLKKAQFYFTLVKILYVYILNIFTQNVNKHLMSEYSPISGIFLFTEYFLHIFSTQVFWYLCIILATVVFLVQRDHFSILYLQSFSWKLSFFLPEY